MRKVVIVIVPVVVIGLALVAWFYFAHYRTSGAGRYATMSTEELEGEVVEEGSSEAALILAERYLRRGLLSEAARSERYVLSEDPANPEAHAILGLNYAVAGQIDQAEKEAAALKGGAGPKGTAYQLLLEAVLAARRDSSERARQYLAAFMEAAPENPVGYYYAGGFDLSSGRVERAQMSFQKALSFEGECGPALVGLGDIMNKKNRKAKALELYRKAVESDPDNFMYRQKLLEAYRGLGDEKKATAELRKILYFTPGMKQVYFERGLGLLKRKQYAQAVELAEKMLSIFDRFPEGHIVEALALASLGRRDSALVSIESSLADGFGIPQIHHCAGLGYLVLDMPGKAEEQFAKAIAVDPRSGRSYIVLAVADQLRGKYDRALREIGMAGLRGEPAVLLSFLKANVMLSKGDKKGYAENIQNGMRLVPGMERELDSSFLDSGKKSTLLGRQRNLMIVYFLNGLYEQVVETGEEVLRGFRKDLFALYYTGLAKVEQGEPEEALGYFDRILFLDAKLISARMSLGNIYLELGELEKAGSSYQAVIEADPRFGAARLALGEVLLRSGDEAGAEEAFRKAVGLLPGSSEPYRRLALLLSGKPRKGSEAVRMASKALELSPRDPVTLDTAGWVYLRSGRVREALEYLRQSVAGMPGNPSVRYHLGIAWKKLGKLEEARRELQTALLISDDFPGAEDARSTLRKLSRR